MRMARYAHGSGTLTMQITSRAVHVPVVTAADLLPHAGFILSGLSHPDMKDSSGWSVYYSSKGVNTDRPRLHHLNEQVHLYTHKGFVKDVTDTGTPPWSA